jgi:hypothetical protein
MKSIRVKDAVERIRGVATRRTSAYPPALSAAALSDMSD